MKSPAIGTAGPNVSPTRHMSRAHRGGAADGQARRGGHAAGRSAVLDVREGKVEDGGDVEHFGRSLDGGTCKEPATNDPSPPLDIGSLVGPPHTRKSSY